MPRRPVRALGYPGHADLRPHFLSLRLPAGPVIPSPNFTPRRSVESAWLFLVTCGTWLMLPLKVSLLRVPQRGNGSCCLALDARRKVGCFTRVLEVISQAASSASQSTFYFQRPGLICESEAGLQSA